MAKSFGSLLDRLTKDMQRKTNEYKGDRIATKTN